MLTAVLIVIFIACFACLFTEGLWNNAILLINVVTAALLATSFFEPLATWLEGLSSFFASITYLLDFVVLWGLFAAFMGIFRAATTFLSTVKVRFLSVADRAGGAFLALWLGWVMVCFATMSLHTAPLAREFLRGGFVAETRAKFPLGQAPDLQWLGFVQKVSFGAFSRSETERETNEQYAFDPQGTFMPKYATRRSDFEAMVTTRGTLRISSQ